MVREGAGVLRDRGGVRQGVAVNRDDGTILGLAYYQALYSAHDPEDTLMIQLTRRETWLTLYGALSIAAVDPNLSDFSWDLLEKFAEILDAQKYPEWRRLGDGEETA